MELTPLPVYMDPPDPDPIPLRVDVINEWPLTSASQQNVYVFRLITQYPNVLIATVPPTSSLSLPIMSVLRGFLEVVL